MSTAINLWSEEKVSVAQLMGDEEVVDEMINDEVALLAEAERMRAAADERQVDAEAGWDDVLPPMPGDV